MTSSKKTLRATFAAIAAATLTMTSAPYAFAQEEGAETTTAPAADSSTPKYQVSQEALEGMPEEANLVIHKSTQKADSKVRDNGTRNEEKEGKLPVKGVKFDVWKLDVAGWDLTTNDGWRNATEAAEGFNALSGTARKTAIETGTWKYEDSKGQEQTVSGEKPVKVTTVTTDANGEADTGNLPAGVYGVIEQNPETYRNEIEIWDASENKAVALGSKSLTGAMPFIVFLPMTDQDNTSKWLQTVNVYPKNSVTNLEKEVKDIDKPGAGNGDESSRIQYTVYTDIPDMPQKLEDYQIVDSMPARVTYVDETATVKVGKTVLQDDGEYTFTETVSLTAGDYELSTHYGNRMIIVNFTTEGLEKLDAAGGDRVQLQFKADVGQLEVGTQATSLTNSAYLIPPNSGNANWDPTDKDNEKECVGLDEKGNPIYGEAGNNGKPVGASPVKENEDGTQTGGDDAGEATQGGMTPGDGDDKFNGSGEDNPAGNNPAAPTDGKPADSHTDDCLPKPPGSRVEVTSKFGKIKIEKVDKEDNSRKLAGAVFQLYTCNADGVKTAWDKGFKAEGEEGVTAKPVMVNGFSTFTTLKKGKTATTKEEALKEENYQDIIISGLELNDWSNAKSRTGNNGKIKGAEDTRFYCLFEVKAPAGYELLAEPIKFQLLDEGEGEKAPVQTRSIANVTNNAGFNLPLTGGKGVLPLIALGGLLVVGAGGYAAVAAKRNRKEA